MGTDYEVIYSIVIDRFHPGDTEMNVTSYHSTSWFNPAQRCGGTIRGVTQQLTYIKNLGCTSVLLNPFFKNNPESYHGYSIEDFMNPDPDWGTMEDVVELVSTAHQLGLKVYFDAVLNHTGNNWIYKLNQPFYNKGLYYSFDQWRYKEYPQPVALRDINLYSRKGAIQQWDDSIETKDGDIFELKDLITDVSTHEGQKTLSIMVDVYSYWMEKTKCDGFRIDAAKHIHSEWLNEWVREMKNRASLLGRNPLFIFGEYIGSDYSWTKEYIMDGAFNFPLYFEWRTPEGIKKSHTLKHPSAYLWINFIDNHDQVGLEPKARIAALWRQEHLHMIWALLLLSPGIPCLYYGTEQSAMGQGEHDGCIREPMFNGAKTQTYLNGGSDSYKQIQKLLQIRRELISFINEKWEEIKVEKSDKNWSFAWQLKGKCLIICLNMSNEELDLAAENRIFHITDTKKSVYLYDGEEWKEEKNNFLVPPHHIAWSWVAYEKY